MNTYGSLMVKYRVTCPECGATLVVASPEASIIWERCPSCGLHAWDMNDLLMAELVQDGARFGAARAGLGIQ